MNILWHAFKIVFVVGSVIQTHEWLQKQHWYQSGLIRGKIVILRGAATVVEIVSGRKLNLDDTDTEEGTTE